jgi:hypothetical protein
VTRYLPVLSWARVYNRATLTSDLVAAAIVTVMLIPQSLAYAMLAGLPPEIGLYASIAPLIAYAIFGSSRALAVGPVAVISLMTLTAAGSVAPPGSAEFIAAALVLALLSGLILVAHGDLEAGLFGEPAFAPGRIGIHYRERHHHRLQPVEVHSRRLRFGGDIARVGHEPGARPAGNARAHPCHRDSRNRFPVLGAQGTETAACQGRIGAPPG